MNSNEGEGYDCRHCGQTMSRKHGEGDGALGHGQKGVERWDNTRGSRRLFPVEAVPREKMGWGSGRAVEEADQGGSRQPAETRSQQGRWQPGEQGGYSVGRLLRPTRYEQ
jgi:hypothetical protein